MKPESPRAIHCQILTEARSQVLTTSHMDTLNTHVCMPIIFTLAFFEMTFVTLNLIKYSINIIDTSSFLLAKICPLLENLRLHTRVYFWFTSFSIRHHGPMVE